MLLHFRSCRIAGYLILFLITGFFLTASAQTTPPKPTYVSYTYLKTLPGKFDAYDSLLRNYSKKIMDQEIKNANYYQWAAYEVLMPTGNQTDYNVVVVSVTDKIDMLLDPPGTMKEVFAKNFPDMNEARRSEVMGNYAAYRNVMKREIYTVVSSTGTDGPPTKKPSKYVQVDYMTPVAGKSAEYVKMETETFKPVHLQRMKLGALMGWVMLEKILPGDTNDPAPFVTVNFYDNFDGMVDGKYGEAVKKAYPTTDADKLFTQVGTVKKGQRIEVWKLMVADTRQETGVTN
jgi:hypothetical protein